MIDELERVALTVDLPQYGLSRNDVGTIVLVHGDSGYEVEFTTLQGETIAAVSVFADQVRPIGPHEIANARALQAA
jgi:hypothetical protein